VFELCYETNKLEPKKRDDFVEAKTASIQALAIATTSELRKAVQRILFADKDFSLSNGEHIQTRIDAVLNVC